MIDTLLLLLETKCPETVDVPTFGGNSITKQVLLRKNCLSLGYPMSIIAKLEVVAGSENLSDAAFALTEWVIKAAKPDEVGALYFIISSSYSLSLSSWRPRLLRSRLFVLQKRHRPSQLCSVAQCRKSVRNLGLNVLFSLPCFA